jgi:hypothetical protein
VISDWPPSTPVAYWDAADVVFQAGIAPLAPLVRATPDRLLVASESLPFRANPVVREWAETIHDVDARRTAVSAMMDQPVLNSGFAAATAGTMLRYLECANDLLWSKALKGSTDWGDQTAMNLYCHSNPESWLHVPNAWNYCLCPRSPKDYRVDFAGRTERLDGQPLYVVHGNGQRLRQWNLIHLTA